MNVDPAAANSGAHAIAVSPPLSLSASTSFAQLAGMELAATPRARSQRKRAVSHAEVLTSSPYKERLQVALNKGSAKNSLEAKKLKGKRQDQPCTSSENRKHNGTGGKRMKIKRQRLPETRSNEADQTPCFFCEIPYNQSNVQWWQCVKCGQWVCGNCACMSSKMKFFECGVCSNP
jgi:hypothetical protein